MTYANRNIVGIIALILSAVLSYLLIVNSYFPYFSVAISFVALSSCVYFIKRRAGRNPINFFSLNFWYILSLVFSFFIVYRSNPLLTILNTIVVFYLGTLMVIPNLMNKISGFAHLAVAPITLFIRSLSGKNNYPVPLESFIKKLLIKEINFVKLVKSLGITFALLLIIIPLLSSANPIFSKLVTDFYNFFRLQDILEYLFSDNIAPWIVRLLVFFFLSLVIPRILSYSAPLSQEKSIKNIFNSFQIVLPKLAVAIIILLFFKTQGQLYFATDVSLQSLGYTNSQYAREVFAQLTIVAVIILGLVYNDRSEKKLSKVLAYLLVVEGIFLSFIALKSVNDYSVNWGFTFKRLWGYTGVFWIISVFILFLFKYYRKLSDRFFIKFTAALSAFVLLAVNIVNFDKLIFHHRKSATENGIDYYYLSGLSPDAKSYRTLLQLINSQMTGMDKNNSQYRKTSIARFRMLNKIDFLQNKYKAVDLRTFNLSEFLEYQSIKSIDTSVMYKKAWN